MVLKIIATTNGGEKIYIFLLGCLFKLQLNLKEKDNCNWILVNLKIYYSAKFHA
jgi:hypothetical protein